MIDFAHRGAGPATRPDLDGSPLQVVPDTGSTEALDHHLRAVAARSDVPPPILLGLGAAGAIALLVIIVGLRAGRCAVPERILLGANLGLVTMMLVGVTRWWVTDAPAVVLTVAFVVIMVGLTWLVGRLAPRRLRQPAVLVAAAVTATAFTLEALSGGWAEPGSLLGARPTVAVRWSGFGAVTFAAYATAVLLVAGALAAAQPRIDTRDGRPARIPGLRAGGVVLLVATAMIIVEGWPTMGGDVAGAVAMTPGVVWLTLRVTVARLRWWGYALVGGTAAAAIGVAARPSGRRPVTALVDLLADALVSPLGIGSIVLGVVTWVLIFRSAVPGSSRRCRPWPPPRWRCWSPRCWAR